VVCEPSMKILLELSAYVMVGCASVVYPLYFHTFEACSIWCWSSFLMGILFIARPDLRPSRRGGMQMRAVTTSAAHSLLPPKLANGQDYTCS